VIEYLSVVRVRGVLAGLFDAVYKSLRLILDRIGGGLWVNRWRPEREARLNLLGDMLSGLLAGRTDSNALRLAVAVMVDKHPPRPFPFSDFNAHGMHDLSLFPVPCQGRVCGTLATMLSTNSLRFSARLTIRVFSIQ
jgi:hypothetical protein